MKNKTIPFKCPKGNYSCPYVDTLTSTLNKDCKDCNYRNYERATNKF